MPSVLIMRSSGSLIPAMLVLGLAYGLLAAGGLHWTFLGGAASPVWPAAGLGFAGLLIGGARLWPAIFLGRIAAGLVVGSSHPFWAEIIIAGGNALGSVVAVLLLQRKNRVDLRLVSMWDVLWLAFAGGLGSAISALLGSAAVMMADDFGLDRTLATAVNWWAGNMLGILTLAPLVLTWHQGGTRPMRPSLWLHLGVILLATIGLAYLVFLTPTDLGLRAWHAFPVLVWAAVAFQVRGASLALLIITLASAAGTTLGLGPSAALGGDGLGSILASQQFAAVASLTILILAAMADERRGKEALARLNTDLEDRVQAAAAQLAQLQKIESLGQLTGGIAHDFNNLLMAITGSLDLLKKRLPVDDERAARLLANAMEGARRGAALTQRLLAFARKQDLRPEPVSIPELVTGMSDLLRQSLGPHIRLEYHLGSGLPKALVDANQLEMAILNLAVNARDAMPEGGSLLVDVKATRVGDGEALPAGEYISLRIIDTGGGMDPTTLRRATEPFFTTKELGKGTGLGLPMVHGLAEQSGGRFTLRSEPGRGTTAEILLPIAAEAEEQLTVVRANGAPTGALGPPAAKQLSVLVVDDDELVRRGLADMLAEAGHLAVQATSGPDALRILRDGQPIDVVVTDQAMPGITGVQLAAVIRTEFPHLPVILMTGYADLPSDVGRVVTKRLDKPFRPEDLVSALEQALEPTRNVVPLRSTVN